MKKSLKLLLTLGALTLAPSPKADGLVCPDTVTVEKPFDITVYTTMRADRLGFFTQDNVDMSFYPFNYPDLPLAVDMTKFPIYKDSVKARFMLYARNAPPELKYFRANAMYIKPPWFELTYLPMARNYCQIFVKQKPVVTGVKMKRQGMLFKPSRLNRSVLGRVSNATIR